MTHPVIILVRPQMGENIGAAARVMANFGLNELRLVAPRDGWPNAKAEALAGHATATIAQAALYATVADAVSDMHFTLATSARDRAMHKPVVTPEEATPLLQRALSDGQRVAILFGPERTGLENEELISADAILTIPTSPEYPSLNLSHAVGIMAYEWDKARDRVCASESESVHLPASKEQLEGMFSQLEQVLDQRDYFKASGKKPYMWRNIRTTLTRAAMSAQEVQTWRGIIRALAGE
jgi:tRNA/rRNA methyltransferase